MNVEEIGREIKRLEQAETTYPNCERLAILYAVRNNLAQRRIEAPTIASGYSGMAQPAEVSEFVRAALNVPQSALVTVLDEHMDEVKSTFPKSYESIMRKIKSL